MNLNTIDLALRIPAYLCKFKLLLRRTEAFTAAAITFIPSYLRKKEKKITSSQYIHHHIMCFVI